MKLNETKQSNRKGNHGQDHTDKTPLDYRHGRKFFQGGYKALIWFPCKSCYIYLHIPVVAIKKQTSYSL